MVDSSVMILPLLDGQCRYETILALFLSNGDRVTRGAIYRHHAEADLAG